VLLIKRLSGILQLTIAFPWVMGNNVWSSQYPGYSSLTIETMDWLKCTKFEYESYNRSAQLILLSVSSPPLWASNDSLNLDILKCCLQCSEIWWRQPKINQHSGHSSQNAEQSTQEKLKSTKSTNYTLLKIQYKSKNQQGKSYLAWSSVAFL